MRKPLQSRRVQFAICDLRIAVCWALAVWLAAAPPVSADWPWTGLFSEPAPVGSPAWWKQHKSQATFEIGKGNKVPGVDGYFDDDGRPISAPVSVERVTRATAPQEEGLLPGLDTKSIIERGRAAVGLGPDAEAAKAAYTRGVELFTERNYAAAADAFQEAIYRAAYTPLEQDAMFMLAECYYFADRYIPARDAYDALVKKHPNTRHLDALIEREWNIARYWEEYEEHHPDWLMTPNAWDKSRPWLDTIGHALKTYDNIRLNDPTGPRADDAIMATANIHFRTAKYDDADYHYTLVRREYPRSEHQFEAHLLGLQAKLRKYQGPDYEGSPLDEARDLVKQIRRQFSGRLSEVDQGRLTTVEAQLHHQVALRDFTLAELYDGTRHYGAARMYYAQVIQQFPNTDLALKARERMAQIVDEPAEPGVFMAGVINLFPQSSAKSRLARVPEIREGRTRLAETPAAASNGVQQANAPSPANAPR
jgi:TolA-binding protein